MTAAVSLSDKLAILYRTIDWMDAHPDNLLMGMAAENDLHEPVPPRSSEATCFCFIGRLCVEADLGHHNTWDPKAYVNNWLQPFDVRASTFVLLNDTISEVPERLHALRRVINTLSKEEDVG